MRPELTAVAVALAGAAGGCCAVGVVAEAVGPVAASPAAVYARTRWR